MTESATAGSLPPGYFDAVYAASDDPWAFETSPYEAAKYADSVAALGDRCYHRAFEIGCSIGVLTRRLAARCENLLAVDVSDAALARARARCVGLPRVEFRRMQVPAEFPGGTFDLIVMSEVGYYWSRPDLDLALERAENALDTGGRLLLVHWTPAVADYPLRGDEVHEIALARAAAPGRLRPLAGWRRETYRLDLLERAPAGDAAPAGPEGR